MYRLQRDYINLIYFLSDMSGGGPYALACAYSLPEEKLKSISIVGGIGPIDIGTKGMNWSNRLIFKRLLHFPAIIRWLQIREVALLHNLSNEKIVKLVHSRLPKKSNRWVSPDLMNLKETEFLTMMLDIYREHYKQGVDGHIEDGRVLISDWGFRLKDIRSSLPIQLWYSKKDTNVTFQMARRLPRVSAPVRISLLMRMKHT